MNGQKNQPTPFFTAKNTVILACLVVFSTIAAFFMSLLLPASNTAKGQITVYITYGSGLKKITAELSSAGMLRNAISFQAFAYLGGQYRKIKAGEYEFSSSDNMIRVMGKLVKGEFMLHKTVVPEGSDIYDIARIIGEIKIADPEKFLAAARDKKVLESLGIKSVTAEGYLFPDTYYFVRGEDEKKIISTMHDRFLQKSLIDPAKDYNIGGYKASGHKILTLASIIEKEAQRPDERPIIASVFYNRLRSPEAYQRRLESCPTVRYALNKKSGPITYKDLKVDSKYNTYIIIGMPPGPIANPGTASMEAALKPSVTNYRYFVANDDGSHTFSQTLAQHNKAKYINKQIKQQEEE